MQENSVFVIFRRINKCWILRFDWSYSHNCPRGFHQIISYFIQRIRHRSKPKYGSLPYYRGDSTKRFSLETQLCLMNSRVFFCIFCFHVIRYHLLLFLFYRVSKKLSIWFHGFSTLKHIRGRIKVVLIEQMVDDQIRNCFGLFPCHSANGITNYQRKWCLLERK